MNRVVIGVGNPYRRDDSVGIEVARRLRANALAGAVVLEPGAVLEHDGEPAGLLDAWQGAEVAYLVDAVLGDSPGRVHRLEIGPDDASAGSRVPASPARDSSHALGIGDAIELGRVLGRLPRRLVLFGIEGADFTVGEGLSAAVDQAATAVAQTLTREWQCDL